MKDHKRTHLLYPETDRTIAQTVSCEWPTKQSMEKAVSLSHRGFNNKATLKTSA